MIIHCRPRLPCQLYAVLYWTDGHKVNIILTITTKNAIVGVWDTSEFHRKLEFYYFMEQNNDCTSDVQCTAWYKCRI